MCCVCVLCWLCALRGYAHELCKCRCVCVYSSIAHGACAQVRAGARARVPDSFGARKTQCSAQCTFRRFPMQRCAHDTLHLQVRSIFISTTDAHNETQYTSHSPAAAADEYSTIAPNKWVYLYTQNTQNTHASTSSACNCFKAAIQNNKPIIKTSLLLWKEQLNWAVYRSETRCEIYTQKK